MTKLNQIIAVEKGVRNRADKVVSEQYKLIQKPDLFSGMARDYRAKDDDGDLYPSESVKVQQRATENLENFSLEFAKIADVVLTKEKGNQTAKGTLAVGDTEWDLPVTYLLFLEKWLGDVHVFIAKLPELEPTEDWEFVPAQDLYRNKTQTTKKTKKIPRVLVKFEPTDKHPGQSDTWYEDVLEGYWDTTKLSGKMAPATKRLMLDNVEKLIDAVKKAREEANSVEVTQQYIGHEVLDFITNV
jgi:hypothetical protein